MGAARLQIVTAKSANITTTEVASTATLVVPRRLK